MNSKFKSYFNANTYNLNLQESHSTMNSCCNPQNQQNDMIHKIKVCSLHGMPINYICLYDGCRAKSLICPKCSLIHQGHPKQTIKNYFGEQVTNYMQKSKKKQNRQILQSAQDSMKQQLTQLNKYIKEKLNKINKRLDDKFKELYNLFQEQSVSEQFQFDYIDNQRMNIIFNTLEMNQKISWIYELSEDFLPLLEVISVDILDNLNEVYSIIDNSAWSEELSRKNKFRQYQYKNNREISQELWPAHFSAKFKHDNIIVQHHGLQAIYQGSQYQHVAVLLSQKLAKQTKISFQIKQLEKPSFFNFYPSTIGIGLCLIDGAFKQNYTNMHKLYSSAFMIASDGQCFLSKQKNEANKPSVYQYDKLQFTFSQGDIIQIWSEFQQQEICFRKIGAIDNRYKIKLSVKSDYFNNLRPFISFSGVKPCKVSLISIRQKQIQNSPSKSSEISMKKYQRQPAQIVLF